jgi:ParB family chromosome partitioning protein
MKETIKRVDVDQIEIKDHLDRTKLDIASLAESIQMTGQINPIVVKEMPTGKYRVVAGRRRTSALKSIQAMTGVKQKALVVVVEIDKLQEELITIDENIMRQQLGETDLDEALYRRKQIYEELHPDTRQHVAGGRTKNSKEDKPVAVSFTRDAAGKLGISKRTVEKSVARAAKATDAVKKARASGLSQSKVDLLVTLPAEDQNALLPLVIKRDVKECKKLVEDAKRRGGKATVLYLRDEEGDEDDLPEMKTILREAERLVAMIEAALKKRHEFKTKTKFQSIRKLEELETKIERFVDYQRAVSGSRITMRRSGADRKLTRARS